MPKQYGGTLDLGSSVEEQTMREFVAKKNRRKSRASFMLSSVQEKNEDDVEQKNDIVTVVEEKYSESREYQVEFANQGPIGKHC